MSTVSSTTVAPDHRWFITIAVMLVAVIEVLDMTIVNVALPHMMGALGANTDQITWVLTSYIVSSAIVMPLTGFLVTRFGRKKVLLVDIIGFLIASMLCGMAVNLPEIVFFRVLQGVFGATLVPLSQYVLRETFSKEEQGTAMAIWGVGIMVAPVLGPTLGGYITESLNWRWIFYINFPICIIAFFMTMRFIRETATKKLPLDWVGLILMVVGIGCLQLFIDQGNEKNWLDSNFIVCLILISIVCLVTFIIRGLNKPDNIINLQVFKDRNFALSTLVLSIFGISMFGIIAIQPMMLETQFGYPTTLTGLAMMPRGIASAIGMAITARLIARINPKKIILVGIVASAFSAWLMSGFTLETSFTYIAWVGAIQGIGMGMFFVPLSAMALSTLPKQYMAEGSGLFSFGRSLGSSIGISLLGTVLTRETQINWNRLGGHITSSNPNVLHWLQAQHLTLQNPLTPQMLAQQLYQQASMVAFVDCYWLTMISFLIGLPLVYLIKKIKP